jgi:hypothetical protein
MGGPIAMSQQFGNIHWQKSIWQQRYEFFSYSWGLAFKNLSPGISHAPKTY